MKRTCLLFAIAGAALLHTGILSAQDAARRAHAQQLIDQARSSSDSSRRIDLFTQAVAEWPSIDSYMQLGRELDSARRYQDAREQYRSAYELAMQASGEKHTAALLLGQISQVFEKENRPLDALKVMQAAAALDNDNRFRDAVRRLEVTLSNATLRAEEIDRGFETTREYNVEGGDSAPSIDLYINFVTNSSQLTSQGEEQARELGKALASPRWNRSRFEVVGHTDRTGNDAINFPLSDRRAATVKDYLVTRFQIATERLSTRGMGSKQPLRTGDSPDDYAVNRRVEVRLMEAP